MCGIFGFFSRTRTISRAALLSSLQALHHRGPDNAGVTFFEGTSRGCHPADLIPDGEWSSVFAHKRLSIIDLSNAANQPMSNEDGSVWITYNGETYNFKKIREELINRGHIFKSRTDSEVVVHGYEEWGTDVVHHLRGMFAFALLDRKKNKVFLARDRLGVKPLKYYYDGETFIFASELRGLIHLVPRKIDLDSLNRFLTLKYIPSPNTILEGVHKLAPGQLLEFDINASRVKTEIFWRPEFYPKNSCPFSEAKEQFKNLLSESVHMRTVSDVPIGVYLSGGMDSSAIVAFLKSGGIDDINTFTIAFDRPGYDESEYARTVAQRFQTRHHEFQIPDLSFDELVNITGSLDEPFGDPSYIPAYFLSRFTAEHVKVVLSGDGGDEILGGYKRYFIYARSKALDLLPRTDLSVIRKLPPEINKKSFLGKLQRFNEELSMGYWGAYLLRFNGLSDSFKRYVMVPELYNSLNRFSVNDLIDNFAEFVKIFISDSGTDHDPLKDIIRILPINKSLPLFEAVVLVNGTKHPIGSEHLGNLKGAYGVHVGSNNRHTAPLALAV